MVGADAGWLCDRFQAVVVPVFSLVLQATKTQSWQGLWKGVDLVSSTIFERMLTMTLGDLLPIVAWLMENALVFIATVTPEQRQV